MFHLTRYKYIFFALSGVVIVPGLLALIFWHLNLGIDFTNGTTISLRVANANVTTTEITKAFQNAHAQDVQVLASKDISSKTTNYYVYIQFSRPIGKSEETTVMQRLSDAKAGLPKVTRDSTLYVVQYPGESTQSALMVVHFDKAVTAAQVQKALANLPPTDLPPTETTSAPAATATPATTATPKATSTPNTKATATPAATSTATASSSSSSSSSSTSTTQTFPVSVSNVVLGQNDNIFQISTQTALSGPQLDNIVFAISKSYGPAYVLQKTEVGPAIAGETARNAIIAVLLAAAAILVYIGIAFRKVGSLQLSFRFGASAIIALLHDAVVVLGLWAIFGRLFDFKVDTLFLTAILTVIGFSVHDTIVVFDRIRENLLRRTSESFETIVNASLIQTMSRSLNTSLTVLFTLAALTLFGGQSTQEFTLALLIGIASGTYSSIFNASMILTVWQTGEYKTWFGRGKKGSQPSKPQRTLVSSRA